MAQNRTDSHRPSAIIPANYSYVGSYFLGNGDDQGFTDEAILDIPREKFSSRGGFGSCSICGTGFTAGDVWHHGPSDTYIHVGCVCAPKYQLLADRSEFELIVGRIKAARATAIQKKINAEKRAAFLGQHQGLGEALEVDHRIIRDIRSRFIQYCELSDKQIALVFKIAAEAQKPAPEQEKLVPAPVAPGRQTFTGTVVSAKAVDSGYGTAYKMTVKVETPEGAWLVWGTCPANVLDSAPCHNSRCVGLRGATVKVTATLVPGREPHFAFMKRPVGQVLALTPENQVLWEEEKKNEADAEAAYLAQQKGIDGV